MYDLQLNFLTTEKQFTQSIYLGTDLTEVISIGLLVEVQYDIEKDLMFSASAH